MKTPATVRGDERPRLFCALRLPDGVLDAVVAWQPAVFADVGVRLVRRPSLHVTLAFLGHRPAGEIPAIAGELRAAAAAADRIEFAAGGYRETRSVGMLVLTDLHGAARALAEDVHGRLERLGVYRTETRPWLPHVTVIRFRQRPRLRVEPPVLRGFSPSDAALYTSVLRPAGAQYQVLESVALGGG